MMMKFCTLTSYSFIFVVFLLLQTLCYSQTLNPNEIAPNFTISTLDGPLIYRGVGKKGSIKGPMIFHAFSSYSGFLEALWEKDSSLLDLIDNSPDNTQYVFLNSETDPHKTALWMKQRFNSILQKYFDIAKSLKRLVETIISLIGLFVVCKITLIVNQT